jgi:hypothetical protein
LDESKKSKERATVEQQDTLKKWKKRKSAGAKDTKGGGKKKKKGIRGEKTTVWEMNRRRITI